MKPTVIAAAYLQELEFKKIFLARQNFVLLLDT